MLRAFAQDFGGPRRRPAVARRGQAIAAEQKTVQRGAIERVARRVLGEAAVGYRIADAPAAAELHSSLVQRTGLGQQYQRGAGILLDDQGAGAAPAKIERQRQPYRATADDQYRGFGHYLAFFRIQPRSGFGSRGGETEDRAPA